MIQRLTHNSTRTLVSFLQYQVLALNSINRLYSTIRTRNIPPLILRPGTEEERSLADKVSGTWIAFTRTWDPNCGKLAKWPPYTKPSLKTMVIDNQSQVLEDPFKNPRIIMKHVLGYV